ncbi:uncharacterized protein LOC118439096 [Folsomia candida]|nr:uncharacterized protein LOC118439096 [Folsomia candida]
MIHGDATQIIARAQILGRWTLGEVNITGTAHFISISRKILENQEFEILTNPNNFIINWVPYFEFKSSSCPTKFVPVGTTNNSTIFVGRKFNLDTAEFQTHPTNVSEIQYKIPVSEILSSTTTKVKFELHSAKLVDMEETFEISVGETAQFHNHGEAQVRRPVSAMERNVETTTTTNGLDGTFGMIFEPCDGKRCAIRPIKIIPLDIFGIFWIELEFRFFLQLEAFLNLEGDLTITKIESRTKTNVIEVTIPGKTSVQVCPVSVTRKSEATLQVGGRFQVDQFHNGCGANLLDKLIPQIANHQGNGTDVQVENLSVGRIRNQGPYSFEFYVLQLNSYGMDCQKIKDIISRKREYSRVEMQKVLKTIHRFK